MLVDTIARLAGATIKRDECRALLGRVVLGDSVAELVKPQTYMNLTGESVKCLLKKSERSVDRMLVISDDLALPFGKIRIRPKGSHGGHNGLRSVIDQLGTNEFARLRIGIMPDHPVANTKDFVLQNFAKGETLELERFLEECAEAVRTVISDGVEQAMARFNG
jgi:PTH1 family peptidyl-tRNA hydrolase